MAYQANRKRRSNQKRETNVFAGLIGGLNTFQDETLIKDNELTEAKNIILDIDGISPRPGTENYGDDNGQSKMLGGLGYYQSDGTREYLTMGSDGKLRKFVSDTPTQIGSKVWDTDANIQMVQARDKVYFFNGVDALSYYDGSSITTYTTLTTPNAPTVSPQGTTGSTTYSYRISAFNDVGETLASTATATTTGTATLSTSNYNQVTWSAVSNATGYNVWGREATGLGETYLGTVYEESYDDKGQSDPSTTIIPPESNTTEGVVCSMAVFALSRLFAAGDPNHPSRLYYSGVGTKLGDFSLSSTGGGYVDVFRNDGQDIKDIRPFQGGVIIWKTNAIYKFTFSTVVLNDIQVSVPQLEEITRSFGGISPRGSIAVENDIVFPAKKDGRLAFYSLGNQENYAGSVIRTNELSIKVAEKMEDVSVSLLPNASSFYYNNIFGCAIAKSGSSSNDRIWCLDTRFGSWVYWEGLTPAFFMTYEDSNGGVSLYYGDETDGYMVEMFKSDRNDNGLSFSGEFQSKAFTHKLPHKFKRFYNPTFQFKDINRSESINGEIYIDGSILEGTFTVTQQDVGGAGTGFDLVGFMLPGEAGGGSNTDAITSSDVLHEAYMIEVGRSIKYNFRFNAVNLNFKLLSIIHDHQVLPSKRLDEGKRSYVTS